MRSGKPAAILRGGPADARERPAISLGSGRALQRRQPQADIGGRIGGPQRVALLQDRGDIGRQCCRLGGFRRQHHCREPRMRAELRHAPAEWRNAALAVQRTQLAEECGGCRERAGGRRVGKGEIGRRGAPGGAIEGEAGELRFQDLRPVELGQAAMQRLGPEPDRHPRSLAPGAAGALGGGGTADAGGDEARQPHARIGARRAAEAAIHDDAHPRHRQRGLGDAGGEHHAPLLGRAERAVLLGGRQVAVQRQHQRTASLQCRLGATDLAHAGQEGEHIALMRGQRLPDGARDGLGQVARAGQVARGMAYRDRMRPAGALDHRRIQKRGEPGGIGGGRHGEQPQLRPQRALQVEAEGEREIGIQRALVDLVQDHGAHPLQPGVGLQAAHQQPLGDDLDPRFGRNRALQPRAVADATPDWLADQRSHARRGGAGGEAARLQHHDAPSAEPRRLAQGQRHQRGLPRAGGCHENRVRPRGQAGAELRQRLGDGQRGGQR
jgi:hypothetical protein